MSTSKLESKFLVARLRFYIGKNSFITCRIFGEKLFRCLEHGRGILEGETQSGGFILIDTKATKKAAAAPSTVEKEGNTPLIVYDQFHPALLASNYNPEEIISFPSLDEAVDDFFSKIESQKITLKQKAQVFKS